MKYERIKLDLKDNLALLTLNHPEVLNAISYPMLFELKNALDQIEKPENAIRCLLITGTGRGFCAGANISGEAKKTVGSDRPPDVNLDHTYNPFCLKLRHMRMPIITAVNGPAAGIGMSIALMGDLVLAAKSAYFLQAFRRIGLVPDGGSTYLLPRLIGFTRAMELSLLGEKLPAKKAHEWGLINRVYDDGQLMTEAMKLAYELAKGPTVSLGLIRRAYWESFDNTYEQQLHLESVFQQEAGRTEDHREGVEAFRQKREAKFTGK